MDLPRIFANQFAPLFVNESVFYKKVKNEDFLKMPNGIQERALEKVAHECSIVIKHGLGNTISSADELFMLVFDNIYSIILNEQKIANRIDHYLTSDSKVGEMLVKLRKKVNYKGRDRDDRLAIISEMYLKFKVENPECAAIMYHRIVEERPYGFIYKLFRFISRKGLEHKENSLPKLYERCRNAFLEEVLNEIKNRKSTV